MRMEAATMNLANLESSAPSPEFVYRPRRVRLSEARLLLDSGPRSENRELGVSGEVFKQGLAPRATYDPTHPDADENGYVYTPDLDVTTELAELMSARRAYEAGLAAYSQSRETFMATLEILRS